MAATSLRQRLHVARSNKLLRAGGLLVGGTAAAQVLTVLALPILTRLYSPHDFQVLAVYAAALAILSVVACGRLEIAIPIAPTESEAANLLALAMLFAAAFAILAAVAVFALASEIATLIGWTANPAYLWLLPAGILLSGSYAAAQYWATRRKDFGPIARTRVGQVGTGLAVQLGLGALRVAPFGLLLGHLLTSAAGSLSLWRRALGEDRKAFAAIRPKRMLATLRRRRRFPIYSMPEALVNTAGIQLPVIMIAALAAGPEAGYLLLAMRAVGMPISLIGGASSQVYLGHAGDADRDGDLADFTANVVASLARFGVGPLLFAGIVAPALFAFVFGAEWARAGVLVSWMTAWSVFRLLSSPVSMVMHVRMLQRAMLALTAFGFVLRVGAVLGARYVWTLGAAESFALASAAFYALCYLTFAYSGGLRSRHHWRIIRAAMPLSVAGVVAGLLVRMAIEWIGA